MSARPVARHVIQRSRNPRVLSHVASRDVASNIWQALGTGAYFGELALLTGRALHSCTFRVIVSTFCGIRWVHDFPPVH